MGRNKNPSANNLAHLKVLMWKKLAFYAFFASDSIFSEKNQLRRVYTSRLRMRLPHFIAFFYYLPWLEPTNVSNKKTQRNAANACVNGMWQVGFNDNPTRAVLLTIFSLFLFLNKYWKDLRGEKEDEIFVKIELDVTSRF